MRTKNLPAIALLGAFLATSAHAVKPQIQWDQSYAFDAVETFRWQDTAGASLRDRNPFMHSRIVNAIEHELAESGLTESQDPDVLITYYTSTNTQLRLQSNSYGYSYGGYGRAGWGYYGYGTAGPVYTTTDVIEYTEGTLVVDIWDAASSQLIWRGTVSDVVSNNMEKVEKQVVKAIEKMAKQGRKLWERSQR